MNKFIASLIAVPVLTISAAAFAADGEATEMLLTAAQMDAVTAAGDRHRNEHARHGARSQQNGTSQNQTGNINVSPAIGIQVLTYNSTNNTSSGGISQRNTTVQMSM